MTYLSPVKTAISVGAVIAAWHTVWVIMVATGVAGPMLDLILKLHFLEFNYTIAPFDASTAITLVGLTFSVGALFGLIFALVWNWLSGSLHQDQDQVVRARSGSTLKA